MDVSGFIFIIANIVTLTIYYPFIRDYIKDGVVFSGSGDGFRQMMPFQLYLYEHFTQLKGFYDHSFGLGGDYVKGLAYYYSFHQSCGSILLLYGSVNIYSIGNRKTFAFGQQIN